MDNHIENQTQDTVDTNQTTIAEVLPANTAVVEPILEDNPNRFVLFPIEHNDIWNFYKKSEASFWTAEEIVPHRRLPAQLHSLPPMAS